MSNSPTDSGEGEGRYQPAGDFELQVGMQLPRGDQAAPAQPSEQVPPGQTPEEQVMSDYEQTLHGTPAQDMEEQAYQRIRQRTEESVAFYAARLDQIESRLAELEQEWDVDRSMLAQVAGAAVAGGIMSLLFGRKWALPAAIWGAFGLYHAVTGWCACASMMHRAGMRTRCEVEEERTALKALRGDFRDIKPEEGDCVTRAQRALAAAQLDGHEW